MRPAVRNAMLIGFAVAVVLAGLNYTLYVTGHDWPSSPALLGFLLCLWPTIFVIPLDLGWESRLWGPLVISVLLNGFLWGGVVSFVLRAWALFKDRRAGGWWPAPPSP